MRSSEIHRIIPEQYVCARVEKGKRFHVDISMNINLRMDKKKNNKRPIVSDCQHLISAQNYCRIRIQHEYYLYSRWICKNLNPTHGDAS